MNEKGHLFQCFQHDRFKCLPCRPMVNHFYLAQPVDRFGQRVEHEVSLHRAADAPANEAPGKCISDEGQMDKFLPSRCHIPHRTGQQSGSITPPCSARPACPMVELRLGEKALVSCRISLVLGSSRSSQASDLTRSCSAVVALSRLPVSRSRWRTPRRNVSAVQSILVASDVMAAHCDSCWLADSSAMRTVCSMTSGKTLVDLCFLAPFFQTLEPPRFPGWLN